jgi:putative chitinase
MSALTLEQLRAICPGTPNARLALFVPALNEAFDEWEIQDEARFAFIAEYAHETQGFEKLEENLYYKTVDALLGATRPRWDALDRDDAWGYLQQPERLANRVYANRFGNGPEASGDGWRFRGRGLPHLTFRYNYAAACKALELDLISEPDLLLQPRYAVLAGAWFWASQDCNDVFRDPVALRKRINGGTNGLQLVADIRKRAERVLA